MSRHFTTSAARAVRQWLGYDRKKLPGKWQQAVEMFTKPGGSAEQKLGKIDTVQIKDRDGVAVHKSHYNPADPADVISVRIKGENGTKTCHVYDDGTGTTKKSDHRR